MFHPTLSLRQKFVLRQLFIACLACLILGGDFVLNTYGGQSGFQKGQGNTINALDGIATLSASDAWAVGWATNGQGSSPLIEHWNGNFWSRVPAPGKGEESPLESVAASSAHDVWAVGDYWQGAAEETLIEHWNGSAWSIVPSPNGPGNNDLRGVAVVSATDAWAVGATIPCPEPQALAAHQQSNALIRDYPAGRATDCLSLAYPPPHPLIEHWDGHAWSVISSPSPDPASQAGLSTVVAFGKDDVWASGSYDHLGVTPADGAALFEHWDGRAWSIRTDFGTAMGGRMWGAAFLSNSDIWGAEYTTGSFEEPAIKHWDGNTWGLVTGPLYGSGGYFVGAMAASAPDDLWAVGNHEPPCCEGAGGSQEYVFTMHWNGSVWSLVPCPSPAGGYISLTASTSRSPNDVWMAGYYYPSHDTQLTFIEHWDGHAWNIVYNPNPGEPDPPVIP